MSIYGRTASSTRQRSIEPERIDYGNTITRRSVEAGALGQAPMLAYWRPGRSSIALRALQLREPA